MAFLTQDYTKKPVRAAAILTNSYVTANVNVDGIGGSNILECSEFNQLMVLVNFTIGSLTDLRVKVEFSPDNSNWYQETFSAISTTTSTESLGEHVLAASGNYRISVPLLDRYVRIGAKGTGTVTSSTVTVDAVLGKV